MDLCKLLVQVSSSQELHGIIYVWSLLFLPAILYSAPAAAIGEFLHPAIESMDQVINP